LLVLFFGVATNTSVTPPAGHDERGEVIGGSGSARVTSEGSDDPHGIGPSGAHAGTSSKASVSISHVIVLRPAQ
jgi:hypothetical protein